MKKKEASRTAQLMAFFRAMETQRGDKGIFSDPYAISFLDGGLKFITKISTLPVIGGLIQKYLQYLIPGAFSSAVARTKYIDDLLKQAVNAGAKRLIILGAGFDTRALRLDFMKGAQVIEIDHPNTAQLKMDTLKKSIGSLPAGVQYWQIDFNNLSLNELAEKHKLDFTVSTTIIWEGVTNYLSAEAINATFKFIGQFASGSFVIFTYVNQLILDKPGEYIGGEKLLRGLDEVEERWTFGMEPETVSAFLNSYGFTLLEDKGAAEYRTQYLYDRQQQGYEFYRVALARKN